MSYIFIIFSENLETSIKVKKFYKDIQSTQDFKV